MTTDPIADMLTRIRNGLAAGHTAVSFPHSKMKAAIAAILKANGYIVSWKEVQGVHKTIEVELNTEAGAVTALTRVSKPGRRVYTKSTDIPVVLSGRGIVIVSTPSGLMTGDQAKKQGLGGELICKVY